MTDSTQFHEELHCFAAGMPKAKLSGHMMVEHLKLKGPETLMQRWF